MENNKNKILIVDDNADNIEIIKFILETIPEYDVYTASDGKSAIQIVNKIIPDIILLDIIMPEMDGFAVANEIKSNPKTKDIPVIFITSLDDIKNKKRAFEIGGVDYITKPFYNSEILCRVKTHLKLKNLIDELRQALDNIQTLKGLLPICAWCKKIRDDKGYWQQVETYISLHSKADFTHSICPECKIKFVDKLNNDLR